MTIYNLNSELEYTKIQLSDTRQNLREIEQNQSQSIREWKTRTEYLNSKIETQNGVIQHLENTLSCYLSEISLPPEVAFEVENDPLLDTLPRIQDKLDTLSAEVNEVKTQWWTEGEHSNQLEELLFEATMAEDDLRARFEELEEKEESPEPKANPGILDPVEEKLIGETQAELNATTTAARMVKTELINKELELAFKSAELRTSRQRLKATLSEKKELESKVGIRLSLVPNQKQKDGGLTVVVDHRVPENQPGRVVMQYDGSEAWKFSKTEIAKELGTNQQTREDWISSHLETMAKLKAEIRKKNRQIADMEKNHSRELNLVQQNLLDKHRIETTVLSKNLEHQVKDTARLYNDRFSDLEYLSMENKLLREELLKLQEEDLDRTTQPTHWGLEHSPQPANFTRTNLKSSVRTVMLNDLIIGGNIETGDFLSIDRAQSNVIIPDNYSSQVIAGTVK